MNVVQLSLEACSSVESVENHMFSLPTKCCHLKPVLRGSRKEGNEEHQRNREQWSCNVVQGMLYGHTA